MAENDQRSYRDPSRWPGAAESPRARTDDPLAELARLIGQSVPMDRSGRDRRLAGPLHAEDRHAETECATGHPAPHEIIREPSDERYSAREDGPHEQELHADPAPPLRASRFRQEPDFAMEQTRDADDGAGEEAAYQEVGDWSERSPNERDGRYPDQYDRERHDADNRAYGDDEYSEDQITGRRGGFMFVAAVFALAVLGTAGAFGYRAISGGPALPALPPIIKAEAGPNKIIPSDVNAQDSAGRENATNTGSRERLVSREERPVDIPPPVTSTAPRSVSTVPVFPDPPPMRGPGAVVGYSGSPPSSNVAISAEPPPVSTAQSMTTAATAPNQAPSVAQVSPPSASLSGSATSGMPGAPGPKKIRTVTIRADQSAASDGPTNSSAIQAVAPRPGTQSQSADGPLSIVPSSVEVSAPAPAARPRTAAPQPVPLNKPAANQTASATPMAPASGGYAVQISSQHSEEEAQSSFRALQAKYPNLLGGHEPIIRRADLGAKGIYFRAMVGPFASADQATELCSNLKAAGGSCIVQKN
jgi:hypothetical protein